MSAGRLRAGELLALAGAVGLLVTLFADWFGVDGGGLGWAAYAPLHGSVHRTGWASLGWPVAALTALAALCALLLVQLTWRRAAPAAAVAAAVVTTVIGTVAVVVLAVRVTALQPGLGAGLPDAAVAVRWPAYLGLAFCALVPLGAWVAMGDDRVDAPESAYTPPPPRPIPGT